MAPYIVEGHENNSSAVAPLQVAEIIANGSIKLVPSDDPSLKELQLAISGCDVDKTKLATSEDEGDSTDDDMVSDGAVDVHGRPVRKSKTGSWRACIPIFGCEVCERVAFYSITSNLVTYLTTVLHENVADSARNVNNITGTTFLTPLFGAFIADAYLGRFWTIAVFLCGYFLSLLFVTMAVTIPSLKPPTCTPPMELRLCPRASRFQVGFFYFALYLMALGAGGIKACVSTFAGDQFDEGDEKESMKKKSFPNWWFVSISFGTMLSVSILVYVQVHAGWSWGYGAPAVVTGICTILFLSSTPRYRHQIPSGSPLTRVAQVICAAFRKWKVTVPVHEELLYEVEDKECSSPRSRKLPHSSEFAFLDKAATATTEDESSLMHAANGDVPAVTTETPINPWRLCTVTQVEEVKLLLRQMPIWLTNLMFSAVFAQVGTLFLSQGTTMDRSMGPNFKIPAASFPLFITLTICIFLPLYDKYFVRFARSFTGDERGLTMLQRIGVGQVISTISIALAAIVEIRRLRVARDHGLLDKPHEVVPMSIFWLLPQYCITGFSEVFISVGQLEFFYDQAPDTMRSVGTALYLSTVAVGSYCSSLLVTIVTKLTAPPNSNGGWIGNNLNRSHLDYFYWLLTVLSTLNLFIYVACAHWYTYKNVQGNLSSRRSSERAGSKVIIRYVDPTTKGVVHYINPVTPSDLQSQNSVPPRPERQGPDLSPLRLF